ncbi:hypothetical protein LOTGIDRAFT_150831 [Lottia gigantea]|uniref:Uncharacterized protein n=1 Tax=Lottia gigantea TaxID=225164 RepID=V3ZZD3_LOTGI|nr:hypothetical protein LOTGIDRAFT_150831 [Lottia gigantea]ESO86341.1 hypothetical protein LOTGIDRAFT_150831 [Lottia gigantea]
MSVPVASVASAGSFKNPKLTCIPDIQIDKSGKMKYILIKVHDPEKDREFKHIVRGICKAEYHADIFDEISPNIESKGLDCECVGGGRIQVDASKKTLQIYGYSQGFGRADHAITAKLLERKYKEYDITFTNDGY